MATDKTITVTVIPTRTGDTVASYNAYSNIDGLLGTMTVGEAAAGKIFSLSPGFIHNITVKVVWTTAGETVTVGSNVVAVDLTEFKINFVAANSEKITPAADIALTGDWSIEFKFAYLDFASTVPLMNGATAALNILNGGRINYKNDAAVGQTGDTSDLPVDSTPFTLKMVKTGTNVELFVNDISKHVYTNGGNTTFDLLFKSATAEIYFNGSLEWIDFDGELWNLNEGEGATLTGDSATIMTLSTTDTIDDMWEAI